MYTKDMNGKNISIGDIVQAYDNSFSLELSTLHVVFPSWLRNYKNNLTGKLLYVLDIDLKVPVMSVSASNSQERDSDDAPVYHNIMVRDNENHIWLTQSRFLERK